MSTITKAIINMQNIEFSDIPICKPYRSFTTPISHGPNIPPNPPNAKNIPSIVPECFEGISETIAVDVGKMIEKQNPVNTSIIAVSEGPNIPITVQNKAMLEKISILFRYPILSTNRLPNSLPAVIPVK